MKKSSLSKIILSLLSVVLLASCQTTPAASSKTSETVTTSSVEVSSSPSSQAETTEDVTSDETSLVSESLDSTTDVASSESTTSEDLSSTPTSTDVISSESISSEESLTSDSISSQTSTSSSAQTSITTTSQGDEEIYHRPADDARWPVSFVEFGQTFRNRLAKLIRGTGSKTITYKQNNDVLASSDKALNGNTGIIPFYHPETDHTTSWNKEHVWPNSRGAGESGLGSDPQMLRPTKSSDNSSRGNKFFGDKTLDTAGNTWDPAEFGYEAARGECARIIFYCATRYYDTCGSGGSCQGTTPVSLSNNPDDANAKHTMGRLDRLVEWNNQYPVTAQEIRRNNYLDDQGFARNPFIDHPEYANWIWSTQGLRTSVPNNDGSGEESSLPEITYKYNYHPITGLSDLSNKVGIAGRHDSTSSYFGMTSEAKGPSIPWYIAGEEFVYENETFKTDSSKVAMFNFKKLENGNYTITVGTQSLYHYIDGTHYSIGYNATDKTGAGNEWKLTLASNGKATIVGATNQVYLEYYNGSFCGYSSAPKESIVLIH